MFCGMLLMVFAFLVAALLQYTIQVSRCFVLTRRHRLEYLLQSRAENIPLRSHTHLFNGLSCPLSINQNRTVEVEQVSHWLSQNEWWMGKTSILVVLGITIAVQNHVGRRVGRRVDLFSEVCDVQIVSRSTLPINSDRVFHQWRSTRQWNGNNIGTSRNLSWWSESWTDRYFFL